MSEKEALCYFDRYPDLQKSIGNNTKLLIQHWKSDGIKEKRNKFCYDEMTIEEAECYLNRYPDLKYDKLAKPPLDRQKLMKRISKPNDLSIEFARRHYA